MSIRCKVTSDTNNHNSCITNSKYNLNICYCNYLILTEVKALNYLHISAKVTVPGYCLTIVLYGKNLK